MAAFAVSALIAVVGGLGVAEASTGAAGNAPTHQHGEQHADHGGQHADHTEQHGD
jgi:hypothetical protein